METRAAYTADRIYPCCMCPAAYKDFKDANICPDCGFIKAFVDERGWRYFVRSGIGEDNYKTFYRKPGGRRERGCRMTEWRKSFTQAQVELNELAERKGWREEGRQ